MTCDPRRRQPEKIREGGKEGNILLNDALNTFYLRLHDVRHMVKDHSAREDTRYRQMGYSFRLAARILLYASSHRQKIAHTTAFVNTTITKRLGNQ